MYGGRTKIVVLWRIFRIHMRQTYKTFLHLISLLYDFYFIFRRRYSIIKKKHTENVFTQIRDFERRLCTQTQ